MLFNFIYLLLHLFLIYWIEFTSILLTLVIYSLIIFSLLVGIIDFVVINVFKSVVSLKPNPETVVLDDTFPSLNHYIKAGKGYLRCLWLLFVWTMNHMVEDMILVYLGHCDIYTKKLEKFVKHPLKELRKITLEKIFLSLSESLLHWET